ncbi:MAG: hypothetical protein GY928_34760 [Colwellia sp.]|nr:hypothetical protein [Colwellia sp.]
MSIIEKIRQQETKILTEETPGGLIQCPKCNTKTSIFKRHTQRKRFVYVIVRNVVNQILTLLVRWRCSNCKGTFTRYPDYLLPYKRYAKDHILSLSREYLENENTSYRKVVECEEKVFLHQKEGEDLSDMQLEGSTVWKWVSFLGKLTSVVHEALQLIRAKSPGSEIFRKMFPVYPRKYISQRRRKILQSGIFHIRIEQEHRNIFGASIFHPVGNSHL